MPTQITVAETTVFIHPSDDPKEAEAAARSKDAAAKVVKYSGSWATGPHQAGASVQQAAKPPQPPNTSTTTVTTRTNNPATVATTPAA
jgi:hypothetical protein